MGHTGLVVDPLDPTEEARKLEERARKESGPVKNTFDLEQFTVFDAQAGYRGKGKWLTVDKWGAVVVSSEIGKVLPSEATVELRLNRKGTILIMRESPTGLPAKVIYSKRGMARRIACYLLKKALLDLGVTLPVRFAATWDPELGAWVGKR